jgi:hypothetical protein
MWGWRYYLIFTQNMKPSEIRILAEKVLKVFTGVLLVGFLLLLGKSWHVMQGVVDVQKLPLIKNDSKEPKIRFAKTAVMPTARFNSFYEPKEIAPVRLTTGSAAPTLDDKIGSIVAAATPTSWEEFSRHPYHYRAQLVALRDRQKAQAYAKSLQKSQDDLLKHLKIFVDELNLPGKEVIYRVQVGNFADHRRAGIFCESYLRKTSEKSTNCIPVR